MVSGNPPRMRLFGDIHPVKYRNLSEEETRFLLYEAMSKRHQLQFEATGGVDFAYEIPGLSRFRVNVYRHLDGIGAVFRNVPTKIQTLEQLRIPAIVKSLARQPKGLILVTGPTGSGKSTSVTAIVDYINSTRHGHIITIEDPVEHIHRNQKCLVSQREIGIHTNSFANALHAALREDPDVILVGEMRDIETISLAVTAAEMGILVLATLHTYGAASTIDRIINAFPAGEEPFIRTMLSTSLCGIISQHLVKSADNNGRLAAFEILVNNSASANIIREGKTDQIENIIQSGANQGMQALDTTLRKLLDAKVILGDEAYKHARNKRAFEQYRESDTNTKNIETPSTSTMEFTI
jgi:twitching motility protein PilT